MVVGGRRRRAGGARLPGPGAALIAASEPGDERPAPAAAADRVEARAMAEDLGQGPAVAVDQPPLAIAVVHRERAALGQVRPRRGDGLAREQVALQPQRAVARHQREGVGQREQHEVVAGRGALQERAPVVDDQVDARRPGRGGWDAAPGRSRRCRGRSRPRRRTRRRARARPRRRCRCPRRRSGRGGAGWPVVRS